MEKETKPLVSEEEAIKELEEMETAVENDKKKKMKKNKKEKNKKEKKKKIDKVKKEKTKKEGKKGFKILLISLIIIIFVLLAVFVGFFLKYYFERTNLEKLDDKVEKLIDDYYKKVDMTTFKGNSLTIKNGKLSTDDFIKLSKEDMPVLATINVDVDGVVSYAIATENYCSIKYAYEKEATIKKVNNKKCKLKETATDYIIKNSKELVEETEETGYVEDLDYASKYYFEGANPDNYIVLANRCFRIVNIANNGNIKAIYDGYYDKKGCSLTSGGYAMIERTAYDPTNNNYYNEENLIRSIIDGYTESKNLNDKVDLSDSFDKLANATWYIGAVNTASDVKGIVTSERTNKGNSALTNQEAGYSIVNKIGLLNVSDFIKASASDKCTGMSSAYSNPNYDCKVDNYLYLEGYPTWSMNSHSDSNNRVWRITGLGSLIPNLVSNDAAYIRPVVYIKGNVLLNGKGTKENPYIVK